MQIKESTTYEQQIELFSLGMLSKFFADMPTADRKELAGEMFGLNEKTVRSWLHCCTNLRNICAHYGRLYFRLLGAIPATPSDFPARLNRSLYSALLMLKSMYPAKEKWNAVFLAELSALNNQYSEYIKLQYIGFPDNWETALQN